MSETDIFDDIDLLVPKKKVSYRPARGLDTTAVDIVFGEDNNSASAPLPFVKEPATSVQKVPAAYSYESENKLISSVTVRPRLSPSRFYADFINDAKKYLHMHAKPCEAVPFPAYIPEYRSMKRSQLDFYLYFRDAAKRGEALDCPMSYILLLLFEIINLPEDIPPNEGATLMCRVWSLYRERFPRLDSYIADWLCDYCLIHRLELPHEAREYTKILASSSDLPEFYCDPRYMETYELILKTAGYVPDRDGRYPECENLLREHLPHVINKLSYKSYGKPFSPELLLPLSSCARTAYRSALCAYNNNALISLSYRSFSRGTQVAHRLSDCIKYAENRVRAHLGIRARLKCPALADADRCLIDEYLDTELPMRRKEYRKVEKVTYLDENEALYEPESYGLSIELAKKIESESWQATELLESAFSSDDYTFKRNEELTDITNKSMPVQNDILHENDKAAQDSANTEHIVGATEDALDVQSDDGTHEETCALGKVELEFLSCTAAHDTDRLKAMIRSHSLIADAVAEKINVYAFDTIGDSVLELVNGEYEIIPDYAEEVKRWLTK